MTTATTQPTVTHGTFVIERTYPATPSRVFDAFSDPAKKRRWFADTDDISSEQHRLDFRVGGTERTVRRMGENTPFPGVQLVNDSVYQDIVPDKRIVFAYTMTLGDHRMSASLATIELLPEGNATRLVFTEQGAHFEGSDGSQRREHGWTLLLEKAVKEITG
jgi:uncharacterized protein YndB with AHSA1/START domain